MHPGKREGIQNPEFQPTSRQHQHQRPKIDAAPRPRDDDDPNDATTTAPMPPSLPSPTADAALTAGDAAVTARTTANGEADRKGTDALANGDAG